MSNAACQIYLLAPDPLPDNFCQSLQAALATGEVAALRLTTHARDVVARVLPITRAHGVALILDGPPGLAAPAGCDGAHISDADDAATARRALGELQLGVFCHFSRDEAMRAGEAGADYVSFGPFAAAEDWDTDLIAWWSELMEIPVVAEGAITAGNCAPLVRAGADFLAFGDAVWNDPQGPAAGLNACLMAIATALPPAGGGLCPPAPPTGVPRTYRHGAKCGTGAIGGECCGRGLGWGRARWDGAYCWFCWWLAVPPWPAWC